MVCKKCGNVIPEDAAFCPVCGHATRTMQSPYGRNANANKRDNRPVIIGCIIFAVVLISGVTLVLLTLKGKNSSTEVAQNKVPDQPPVETEAPVVTKAPVKPKVKYITYYVTNCYERITLRERPSTTAAEVCDIPLGAAVSYIETAGNGFYKVNYNGNTGYALASYLTKDSNQVVQGEKPADSKEANTTTYPIYYVTGCDRCITLRESPSTSATKICDIPLGAPVSYIETSRNGFYKVIYDGQTGYALASYLCY